MTEWREWRVWRQVTAAANDVIGSAATVGVAAAQAVAQLTRNVAEYAPEAFPEACLDAVDLLASRHGSMAPIANLRNTVYLTAQDGPDRVVEAVGELAERLARSTDLIGKVGADLIEDGSTVLIHSASSSVGAMLEAARHDKHFRVCCTEALPIGEGIEMAAELVDAGFEVEVIPDDTAIELLAGMDLVLVGADAIGPGEAINKVGTADIAEEAARIGVALYLVAAVDKFLPEGLYKLAEQSRSGLSELVPLDLVTAVVTDVGVLSIAEVRALADRAAVAEGLGG